MDNNPTTRLIEECERKLSIPVDENNEWQTAYNEDVAALLNELRETQRQAAS